MKKGILRSFAFVCVLLTVFTVLPVANARAILKINNNQRGETRQDNHVGRRSERQIE